MNRTVLGEWLLRLITIGVGALTGWIGLRYGAEVGGAAGVLATAAATKAIPYFIPSKEKVAAANQIPKPLPPLRKGLPGS